MSAAAPASEFAAGLDLTIGEYDRVSASGFVNLPAGEMFQFRVSARSAPTEAFNAVLRHSDWREPGGGGAAFGYRVGGAFVNPATGALDIRGTPVLLNIGPTELDGIPDVAGRDIGRPINPDPLFYPGDTALVQDLEQSATSLNVSYDFGPVTVRSITGYIDYEVSGNADNDFTATARNVDGQDDKLTAISQEIQLASSGQGRLEWILGYYYFNEDIKHSIFSSCPSAARNTPGCAFAAGFPETTSNAFFGQGSYWLVEDRVRVTAGVRHTEDEKEIRRDAATTDAQQRVNSLTPTGQGFDLNFDKTTWRINGESHFDSGNMLYATVSTSFRSGGFNSGSLTNPLLPAGFEPEEVTAYEIGSKNRFLDNRLQLNIPAHRNDFKDLQVQNQFIIVTPTGTTTTSVILNAAKAHSQGVEIEVEAAPVDNLNLAFSATLMEVEFDDYRNTPAPARYSGFYDLSGNDIPYSPSFKLTGIASYDFALGTAGTITPQVVVLHSDSYQLTDFNTVLDKQDSYTKVDVRLGWRPGSGRYSAEAFVNNATDEITKNRATFGSRGQNQSYDAPRMRGV